MAPATVRLGPPVAVGRVDLLNALDGVHGLLCGRGHVRVGVLQEREDGRLDSVARENGGHQEAADAGRRVGVDEERAREGPGLVHRINTDLAGGAR